MSMHSVVVETQTAVLHVVAAGLTATSIGGALGYIPTVVAVFAGLCGATAYIFATLDSPSFQRLINREATSTPPETPSGAADGASGPKDTH